MTTETLKPTLQAPAQSDNAPTFPLLIQTGSVVVKIYKVANKGRDSYTLSYVTHGKRKLKMFADLEKAIKAAERIGDSIGRGELEVLNLRSKELLSYRLAIDALKATGVPLEVAAVQFAQAFMKLNGKATLLEAAEFYVKRNPNTSPTLVSQVIKELLEAKEADGMSDVYVQDLRSRLKRVGGYFKMAIGLLTSAEIENFLRGLKSEGETPKPLTGRSRNNYRRAIGTLLYFAESRGYIGKGVVDVEAIAVAKQNEGDIEIFTVDELTRIFATARPALVPFLAIGAFAGLRSAEIERLDWSEVRLDDGFIEVKASKAKTASRRLVPISENLKLWLTDHKKPNGDVCPFANMSKQLLWLAEDVHKAWQTESRPGQFKWKHNALRHSFISYRVAQVQNVAQVALEAGNSPKMVFSNYRELVRPTDAQRWFAITPDNVGELKTKLEREQAAKIIAQPVAMAA
ncbi:MAG: tyrosine-type recombinase/integrase [Limisphaerales bacterium]